MSATIKGNWTASSAYNLDLALKESREWIEAVVGQKFPSDDFQVSLKNGVFLCKLINQIKPGIVPKINPATTDFAYRENLSFFIKAAKQLGLRDTQLFDTSDLYESKRIRNVAISLYWLGRAARGISTYKGPQLNLLAFQKMNCSACKKAINDSNYLATLTQQYHTACAVCCQCSCKLDPKQPFFMEGNNIWCQNCMVGATSIGSGSSSSKPGANKSTGHKHNHDNECTGCHGSLADGYVPDDKDQSKKYCTKCICDLCHSPLIGNFSVINGEKICDDCSCSGCGKGLKDGFFEEGLARYCEPCNDANNKRANQKSTSPNSSSPAQSHDHHGHNHDNCHGHGPKTTTTNNNSNNNNNTKKGCKECNKPLDSKPKVGNDRDKFCPPHEKENCCGGCDREIEGGQVLQAMDKSWHPKCFKCDKCSKDLTKPGETIKKGSNGNPLCGPCSSSGNNSNNCGGCSKPVVGSGVEALDKKWHPACFKCNDCKKTLGDEFVEVGNTALCDGCYNKKPASPKSSGNGPTTSWGLHDKCAGCVNPLAGEVTKVNKHYWHRGCFKCDQCKAALQTGYFLHGDDRPHCRACHDKIEAAAADKCPKCNKPIVDGAIVKASGKMWHKQCFCCTKCSKQIGDGSTFTRFSKPYCRECWNQEKAICNKCRNQIQGDVVEVQETGKMYCVKCAPGPTTSSVHYGERIAGFTINPQTGKKTIR